MLFAEYSKTANTLSFALQSPAECGDCSVCIERERIEFRTGIGSYVITIPELSIAPVTCNNLSCMTGGILSCSFNASQKSESKEVRTSMKIPLDRMLADANNLLCKFCHNTIASINDMKTFKAHMSLLCLEESGMEVEENYFCHSTCPQDRTNKSVSVPLHKSDIDLNSITQSVGLHTGTEVLLPLCLIKPDSFKHQLGKYVHCAHCLMALGSKVSVGSNEAYALWTNCLDAHMEELDIDGDFLRYIEKPILDEMDFYASLIDKLVENQCYRIILSAVTWHGCVDFMLLWLLDQKVCIYTAPIPKPQPLADQIQSVNDQSAINLKLESFECRRVFYQLVLSSETDESQRDGKPNSLDIWKHDFNVYLLTLPWETCVGLATCLQQFTHRIAPHLRHPGQHMAGFSCGAIPSV